MLTEKCCCPCVDIRAGTIVLSIWKLLIGNGCLSFVETGELLHNSRYIVLIACNVFGTVACCCLLYGAIQCKRIAIFICLILEMGEILLVLAYCALLLGDILREEKIDASLVRCDVLFFLLAFALICFWIIVWVLYIKIKVTQKDDNDIYVKLKW